MIDVDTTKLNETPVKMVTVKTNDIVFKCMSLGATILDLQTKNKAGQFESIVMQFDSLDQYPKNKMRLNQLVGATAGRYQVKSYQLGSKSVFLEGNDGLAHLHGGDQGYQDLNFDVEVTRTDPVAIHFKAEVNDFHPGVQTVEVVYTIDKNTLTIDFIGDTTEETLYNLTHHVYFNLSGNLTHSIHNHSLQIGASKTLGLNADFVPETIRDVEGTHLDFRQPDRLFNRLTKPVLNRPEKGIDNPLLLDEKGKVTLYEPNSTRHLKITTNYPCVVVYTDNHILGYQFEHMHQRSKHMGICFETQLAPNGNNIQGVKSSNLKPDEHYHYTTKYTFTCGGESDD